MYSYSNTKCSLKRKIYLLQDYAFKVDFHNPATSIRKGNAVLFSISAFITEPSADLEFGVFQPLGYNVRTK